MLWRQNSEPTKAQYRTVEVEAPPIGSAVGRLPVSTSGLPGSTHDQVSALSRMANTIMTETNKSLASWRALTENFAEAMSTSFGNTRRELVKPAETIVEHLVRLTWLETVNSGNDPGLRLTELGRALLRDREQGVRMEDDVNVVVLEANDPLAYPLLVGQLANAGAGLLADPYLKLDGLHRIVVSTQLTRLLVLGKPHNSAELAAMQTYLDSPSLGRRVEIRKSTDLHDRALLTEDGSVLTLGTSLNGVGSTTTVLTPMPEQGRLALRDYYEQLWAEGELVGPQYLVDGQTDDDEDGPGGVVADDDGNPKS